RPRARSPRSPRVELFVLLVLPRPARRRDALRSERLIEPFGQLARRVMAARAQELIPRGHFHEDRDASSGRDGHADEGDPQSEDLVELDVEAQALVLARGVPAFELDYQL